MQTFQPTYATPGILSVSGETRKAESFHGRSGGQPDLFLRIGGFRSADRSETDHRKYRSGASGGSVPKYASEAVCRIGVGMSGSVCAGLFAPAGFHSSKKLSRSHPELFQLPTCDKQAPATKPK